MGAIIPQVITNSGAQIIEGSLKINQTLTQHLSKTFGSGGNRKTITWSAWVRRAKISGESNLFSVGNSSTDAAFRFNSDDTLQVRDGNGGELTTSAKFRDTGWYHIVVKIDTTQSTAADRFRLYVNGSETVYSAASYASEDANIDWNDAVNHYIGRQVHNTSNLYDGAICQVYFIDGQALGPENFGFTDGLTNTWKPKKYEGTFGTTGFYLPMDNEDDFEKDKSGNGNDWTKNNFSGTSNDPDVLPGSPSGISYSTDSSSGITTTSQVKPTTWATLNPLDKGTNSTLSDGNLKFSGVSSAHRGVRSSIRPTIKVYAEMVVHDNETGFGFATDTTGLDSSTLVSGKWAIYNNQLRSNGSSIASITTLAVGDLIQVAYDPDSNKAWIGRNNLWYDSSGGYTGNPATGANATFTISEDVFIYTHSYNAYDTSTNFGQKPFKYAPPDGFRPLCAANTRPDKVISRPDQYVGVVTFIGNDGTQNIGFGNTMNFDGNPDLVWIKALDDEYGPAIFDTVRGVNKRLRTDGTNVEQSMTTGLTSFDHNGFTVGSHNSVNESPDDYVAWCWRAGGNKNTYNIDNVGYSTSADVGFDAGGLNDVAYDSSRTWSSNMVTTGNSGNWHASYPVTNAFNGDHTDYAHGNADGSVSATVTLTFNPAIACEENVTFMGGFTNTTNGTGTISINGGQTVGVITSRGNDPAATDVTLVPFTGDISTIVIDKTSSGAQGMIIYGFKIDGVELLDNGVTPTYNYPTAPSTGCSVGTKQGFSIVSYTGNSTNPSTHAHGLLKAPQFVIIKNRDRSSNGDWIVGHANAVGSQLEKDHRDYGGFKEGHQLILNSANAVDGGSSNYFSNANPDRFTFTVKDNYQVNYSGEDYIAYLWHDVPGLQKFGYYIGNGNSDGTYVELGFRPALLWIKNAFTGNETWCAHDSKRDPFNRAFHRMSLESAAAQTTANADARGKDLLSNGFKIRGTSGEHNTNGDRYIYCAWAEAPAVDLFGGGANAR